MRARARAFLLLFLVGAGSFGPSASTDAIGQATSISGNQTLVSSGGVFQLGFFTPPSSDDGRTYLGIWYANITGPTVVWVANRQNPLVEPPGVLRLSADGRLVILDHQNATVWHSPAPTRSVTAGATAQIRDDGNFVLSADGSGSDQSVAWQSFDYPTDTLLPGMKLGVDTRAGITRNITSWRTPSDPSPGPYTFKLVLGGMPEFFLFRATTPVYGSGPFNGQVLTGVPNLRSNDFAFEVVSTPAETYYSYSIIGDASLLSRFVVNGEGKMQRFVWIDGAAWSSFWYYPTDPCDSYATCGAFGYCDIGNSPLCSCLPGFQPRSPQQWNLRDSSSGCVRTANLTCGGDGFWVVNRMKLPDATNATVYASLTLDRCRQVCLSNCSCQAYAAANVSWGVNRGCVIWAVDLLDMRQYSTVVQDVYIRLAQSEVDALIAAANHRRPSKRVLIAVVATACVVLLLLLAVGCCYMWWTTRTSAPSPADDDVLPFRVRRGKRLDDEWNSSEKDVDLPLIDLAVIVAGTDNFAAHAKIGEGGFGPVYMGELEDGQEVAVKRLSCRSTQGVVEFKNEAKLINRLQHRNLVRLLGCCIDEDERILVYEYMHNQSLDTFIFGKRRMLKWQKRFEIILGIARGLLYLHQDSRFRIIHRDLKASNVLLDNNMIPKISDFGVARMFGGDQTTAYTSKVIGTYGYMSPEYAMDGMFSMKSDVYSFGVLVLEIITGKRNRGSYNEDLDLDLLRYAWMLWKEGRAIDLLDDIMDGNFNNNEVVRCVQVALLCVEVQPKNRPLMSSVVTMLAVENTTVLEPNEPGVKIGGKNTSDTEPLMGLTVNNVTITAIDAR